MQFRSITIKRLLYRSSHRGQREMDLLLKQFNENHLTTLDDAELSSYADLLNESDGNIFNWLTKRQIFPEKFSPSLVSKFLNLQITR